MTHRYSSSNSVVGVTTRHGSLEWLEKNTGNYIRVLKEHSVHVVALSPDTPAILPDGASCRPTEDGILPETILDTLDGLILSGGGDVHPRHFGQEIDGTEVDRIDHGRDALELTLTRAALARDMPIFGICRGCQVLNIAAGGGIVQHFDGHQSPKNGTSFHQVSVVPGTRLQSAAQTTRLTVNTFHHQGVDAAGIAPGYIASGFAEPDSWLVEAIESPKHAWVLGVQWHPERLFELDSAHERIWNSYFAACSTYRSQRQS